MSLKEVRVTSDCYKTCVTHSLMTEKEEVMGLLLGNIENNIAYVWDVCLLSRSYKQSDRVEISEFDLVEATKRAEKLSKEHSNMFWKCRVVGWFHSHPHITPYPSHVDLQCQNNYQMMDSGFVGLIFSVYNKSRSLANSVEVYSFQSVPKNSSLESTSLSSSLRAEKKNKTVFDPLSSRSLRLKGSRNPLSSFERKVVEVEKQSLKEAQDYSRFERKDTKITVINPSNRIQRVFKKKTKEGKEQTETRSMLDFNFPCNSLKRVIDLQEILLNEEKDHFQKAISKEEDDSKSNMKKLLNLSIYQYNLIKLLQNLVPLKKLVQKKLELRKKDLSVLKKKGSSLKL